MDAERLLKDLQDGCLKARNKLMLICYKKICKISKMFGSLSDDTVSHACVFALQSLEQIRLGNKEPVELRLLINGCIRFGKLYAIADCSPIRTPKKAGAVQKIREAIDLSNQGQTEVSDFEIKDSLQHCILNQLELKYVRLKLENPELLDIEINRQLGVGITTLSLMKKRLYERLKIELCQK